MNSPNERMSPDCPLELRGVGARGKRLYPVSMASMNTGQLRL